MVNLHAGGSLDIVNVFKYFLPDVFYVSRGIFILDCPYWEVYLLIEAIAIEILIIFWNRVFNFNAKSNSCFVSPASGDILDSIASSSHHNGRQVVAQHEV